MYSPSMPPLVEPPPFIPPPQGATNGGQPGVYAAGNRDAGTSPWLRGGTSYPAWPISPHEPPNSAASWTYGAHTPWAQPSAAVQPPAWGQTPAPWGPGTPAGTWSASSPAGSWGPQTPAAYSPWVPPQQQQQQTGGTWITPNMINSSGFPRDEWLSGAAAGYTGYPEGKPDGGNSQPLTPKKKSHSVKRSSSKNNSPKRPPLYRSTSWGNEGAFNKNEDIYSDGHHTIPAYAKGDVFDEKNLARRPLDWRPDYKPKFPSIIPGLTKIRTEVTDYVDPIKRTLHPLLLHIPNGPPVNYNLLETLFHTSSVQFLNLHRPHNAIDFAQLACQPPAPLLRLFHPRLPWYIDIQQVHPNGITVVDILTQMHAQLYTPIYPRHFYNEELTDADRAEITKAFQVRCRGDPTFIRRGVLQLDFLGEKVVFEGLSRGSRGLWEIKLSKERL